MSYLKATLVHVLEKLMGDDRDYNDFRFTWAHFLRCHDVSLSSLCLFDVGDVSLPISQLDVERILEYFPKRSDGRHSYILNPATGTEFEELFKDVASKAMKHITCMSIDEYVFLKLKTTCFTIVLPNDEPPRLSNDRPEFSEEHGYIFATLFVQIPVEGGYKGGEFKMENSLCNTYTERNPKNGEEYLSMEFLCGKSNPKWNPVVSGCMAYIEFDVYWRPSRAVSKMSITKFASAAMLIETIVKSDIATLVFPLSNSYVILSFDVLLQRDVELSTLLLSIPGLVISLATIKKVDKAHFGDVDYAVESLIESNQNPISNSIQKVVVLKFPFNFVGELKSATEQKHCVFIVEHSNNL